MYFYLKMIFLHQETISNWTDNEEETTSYDDFAMSNEVHNDENDDAESSIFRGCVGSNDS